MIDRTIVKLTYQLIDLSEDVGNTLIESKEEKHDRNISSRIIVNIKIVNRSVTQGEIVNIKIVNINIINRNISQGEIVNIKM